ncbi:hypothetical protein T8K17_01565 [Thalassobaculum sp. OXR-137]|uniref:ImuA family protein n=1 Tax=Thalassobaculum sp. OXR-137 TaxID=3100173 RepID=UPI002AC9A082|nr:hypothetical protein [Thalassobaculum sp. OXR-137]WPZ34837.1 hypothetical protein T8K17_01565 [Thalassobaculum sp. OXR-137]
MADPIHAARARPDRDALMAEIRRLERAYDTGLPARTAALGCDALAAHLPEGGLALGRVHELVGEARSEVRDAAVFGFACALLARLGDGPVLWCARHANVLGGAPSARGLASLGLDPARVIFVDAAEEADRLWAMEEGLSVPGLAAVVAELDPARRGEVTASRRLQLAAEKSGVTGLILRPRLVTRHGEGDRVPLAVETRWQVTAAPSPYGPHDTRPVWDVTLERARRGRPGRWRVAWNPATGGLEEAIPAAIPAQIPRIGDRNDEEVAA